MLTVAGSGLSTGTVVGDGALVGPQGPNEKNDGRRDEVHDEWPAATLNSDRRADRTE